MKQFKIKKFVAVVLTVCLTLGTMQGMASALAANLSTLTTLTVTDFYKMTEGVYTTEQSGYATAYASKAGNLKNTVFEADITFGAAGAFITYGGANGNMGLKLLATDSGLTLSCVAHSDVSADVAASWVHELTSSVAGTTLVGNKFNLKLSVEFEDTDTAATVGVWINDELYNDTYFIMENMSSNKWGVMGTDNYRYYLGIHATESATIAVHKPGAPIGYTPLTLLDYDVDDGETSTNVVKPTSKVTSFDKVVFQAEVKFPVGNSYIRLGTSNWEGIGVVRRVTGTLGVYGAWSGSVADLVSAANIDFSNYVKIAMYFLYTGADSQDLQVKYYINDSYMATYVYEDGVSKMGNYVILYGAGSTISWKSVGEMESVVQETVSYDITDKDYLVTFPSGTINGEAMTTGDVVSMPGDYTFEWGSGFTQYTREVILYKLGDVDLDGMVGETEDYTVLSSIANGGDAKEAAKKAADFNNDGNVNAEDVEIVNRIINNETTLETVLDEYYPPALSYDYLGGNEVMPIAGFFGPYLRSGTEYNYLTDEIFKLVQSSGINLINYAWRDYLESPTDVKAMLELAEEYRLGYFVGDANLNTSYDFVNGKGIDGATALSETEVATQLSNYSYYQSTLGTHVLDEPIPDGTNSLLYDTAKRWMYYKDITQTLNTYVNTNGFLTMRPEDGTCFGVLGDETYSEFWDTCIGMNKETKPQVLAYDDYPFNDDAEEGVENATGYFTSLSIVRKKALDNKLPFWVTVQAGGDFKSGTTANNDLVATEEETYWNVNTSLAYGAKGIAWFTLLQSPEYVKGDETAGNNSEKAANGLIGVYGETTKYYDWAQNANQQILAVDEVLMKASNKGVIAAGGTTSYAYTQTANVEDSAIINVSATESLTGVAAGDTKYGALVGCFDYKEKEAYYVVNYDVTPDDTQTITLAFDKEYSYYTISAGTKSDVLSGDECALNIPSGEAVLVVIEGVAKQPESWEIEGDWEDVEIYPADFAIGEGKYERENTTVSNYRATGIYAPLVDAAEGNWTLEGKVLSANVVFSSNYSGLIYGGSAMGKGFHLQLTGDNLSPGWIGSGAEVYQTQIKASDTENLSTFAGTGFNLKISMRLVNHDKEADALDVQVGVYINDKLHKDSYIYFDDQAAYFGNYMSVRVDTAGGYVEIENPEFEPDDYAVFTTSDIGIGDTYYPASIIGTYKDSSMDGTLFTANLDFKNNNANYICFAGSDGSEWKALRIGVHATGPMYLWAGELQNYEGADTYWNFGTPAGLFNLKVATQYVDFDRDGYRDDLKIGIWMNDEIQKSGQHIHFLDAVGGVGNNFIFYAPKNAQGEPGAFTIKEAPLVKEQGEIAYNLSNGDAYNLPEGVTDILVNGEEATAESTYTESGDYTIQYRDMATTYSGEVVLYRRGDTNTDEVVDSRDLIRMKKDRIELTLSDVLDTTGQVIPDGEVTATVQGTFQGVSTLDGAAVTIKTTFAHSSGGYIRIGGSGSNYYGVHIGHKVQDGKNALIFQWNAAGVSAINKYIYDADVEGQNGQLWDKELKLRLEFCKVGEDLDIAVFIDDVFVKTITYEGQAANLGTGFLATKSTYSIAISKVAAKKAILMSADIDKNGIKDEDDIKAFRQILVGDYNEVVFGVLSDSHLLGDGSDADIQKRVEAALNYYKQKEAEVIIVNGDLTESGAEKAYRIFTDIFEEVYADVPKETAPELVITGESYESYAQNISVQVGDYTFIGVKADESTENTDATYTGETLSWIEDQLLKAVEADSEKAIFVAVHQPLSDTESRGLKELLARYPQVVLFISHTHGSLENEEGFYQDGCTIVNTGAVCNGEALLVRAQHDWVEIQRYNVSSKSQIGDKWMIGKE